MRDLAAIATVTLASCAHRTNRLQSALVAYRTAVRYWQQTGSWVQQWTTLRNAAELLADRDQVGAALTILSAADTDPDAPALAPDSATRLSRRMHELRAQLGAEAARVVQAESRRPRTEIVALALGALAEG